MTVTTVEIYDQDGNNPITGAASTSFDFDPVPTSITFRQSNSPGKMPLDLPSYQSPTLFWSKSMARTLSIKTVVLGTDYTSQPILDWIDDVKYIANTGKSTCDYLIIRIPANENYSGTTNSYTGEISDATKENAMFSNGKNYMQFYCHPDDFTIDKVTRNIWFITISFSLVSDVTVIG